MQLNPHPYINRTVHGVDFLGCRVFPDHVILNRRSRLRFRRKMSRLETEYLEGESTPRPNNIPRQSSPPHSKRAKREIQPVLHCTDRIEEALCELRPVQLRVVANSEERALFAWLLHAYHYLSYSRAVGENLQYLIYDQHERPLGCLLFGAAAWKASSRDHFIGWNAEQRARHLPLVANNMRFLIMPWVRVAQLASHILGLAARTVSSHWEGKYGHPIMLLETFVEKDRFRGTSYAAANWTKAGTTKGRSRNDHGHRLQVPAKDIYCYPLSRHFRRELTA